MRANKGKIKTFTEQDLLPPPGGWGLTKIILRVEMSDPGDLMQDGEIVAVVRATDFDAMEAERDAALRARDEWIDKYNVLLQERLAAIDEQEAQEEQEWNAGYDAAIEDLRAAGKARREARK
jgi:hypothetical protein